MVGTTRPRSLRAEADGPRLCPPYATGIDDVSFD
jgi:hypothetical protein